MEVYFNGLLRIHAPFGNNVQYLFLIFAYVVEPVISMSPEDISVIPNLSEIKFGPI